ncbi:hypothetical protein SCLCIDRAFT_8140 [Scleroderma citrinum Foug A]|uniref:Uncharacterized protein n=1 Tax=Scleroderma citrinum Foug A TaxID=1036808 RepID=A0A0C3AL29_9AGAM|nr:hypothetical protein SCLCIDRAFT_8140 [Scleroderma citrinum Foug A]
MAPTTRPQNKGKHPGLPDLPRQTTQSPSKAKRKSNLEHNTIVKEVTTLEMELRMKQKQTQATARQPPGPTQDKQPRSQSAHGPKLSEQKATAETSMLDDNTAGKGVNAGVNKISAGKKQKQSGSRSNANEQIHANESESIAIEKESKRSGTRATGYQIDVDARSDHLERDTPMDICGNMSNDNSMDVVKEFGGGEPDQTSAPYSGATDTGEVEVRGEMMVDDEDDVHVPVVWLGMRTQDGKGKWPVPQRSPHRHLSHGLSSPLPATGLLANWHFTAHTGLSQSQLKSNISNSNHKSQPAARPTSNRGGALLDSYKQSCGGLGNGDDTNDHFISLQPVNLHHHFCA